MIIHHTEVNDPLKGQNIGKKLVNTAVEYARKQQLKILSLCSSANTLMKRHKALFADVLKEN
jgi:predicted GNAT family acetyltransferase